MANLFFTTKHQPRSARALFRRSSEQKSNDRVDLNVCSTSLATFWMVSIIRRQSILSRVSTKNSSFIVGWEKPSRPADDIPIYRSRSYSTIEHAVAPELAIDVMQQIRLCGCLSIENDSRFSLAVGTCVDADAPDLNSLRFALNRTRIFNQTSWFQIWIHVKHLLLTHVGSPSSSSVRQAFEPSVEGRFAGAKCLTLKNLCYLVRSIGFIKKGKSQLVGSLVGFDSFFNTFATSRSSPTWSNFVSL